MISWPKLRVAFFLVLQVLLTDTCRAEIARQFPEQNILVVIPGGFEEVKGDEVPKESIALYRNGNPPDGKPNTVINLAMMPGGINPDAHLSVKDLPPNLRDLGFTVGSLPWSGLSIDTIEGTFTQNGVTLTSVVAQIPTAPNALQISFAGPVEDKEAIQALAKRVVASVVGIGQADGPVVRKLSIQERVELITGGLVKLALVCALGVWIFRVIKKKMAAKKTG